MNQSKLSFFFYISKSKLSLSTKMTHNSAFQKENKHFVVFFLLLTWDSSSVGD